MIHGPVDSLVRRIFSKANARVLYILLSCLYLKFVFSFWIPMTYTLWDVQQKELKALIYGGYRQADFNSYKYFSPQLSAYWLVWCGHLCLDFGPLGTLRGIKDHLY